MFDRKKPVVGIRGIHLDLKGLPPTEKRLYEILDIMALAGINAVLVEWEDTYPWSCPELRNRTAYSVRGVNKFLDAAERLSIEVIPLVQCFGHLETVLSKRRFSGLREDSSNMSELCPSREGSRKLVKSLIDDILKTHRGRIKHFHLGGDEAFIMGSCPACKKAVEKEGKAALYMKQVLPLLDYLRGNNIQPVLWFDMMLDWRFNEMKKLAGKTDLMAWAYNPVLRETVGKAVRKCSRAGINVWGASAFKGADGVLGNIPDMEKRRDNILSWLDVYREENLKGIVATGWSRFNSFMSPCESLEVSLHSLVVSARAMWDGKLPGSYKEESMAFLNRGKLKRLAGERFEMCLEAGTNVQKWTERFSDILCQIGVRAAHLAGEKERKNPHEDASVCALIESNIEEGKTLLDLWVKAHKGLVPDIWLKYYRESRLRHFEDYGRLVIKKLS